MKVLLMRHGDADADIPEGLGDEARTLTARGRAALASHYARLSAHIGSPDFIFTSPLARCVQTSQLLAVALDYQGPLRAHRSLLPDGPVGAMHQILQTRGEAETVVLVGHQPSVGSFAASLLGLQSLPKPMLPGTVVAIDLPIARTNEGLQGSLLWYAAVGDTPGKFDAPSWTT